jgi:hypothetical protein
MDLGDATHTTFSAGEITLDLTLDEVSARAAPADATARTPFSLVFKGPVDPVLGQQMYPLVHAELGELEIFIVPIGQDDSGTRYEAVFA